METSVIQPQIGDFPFQGEWDSAWGWAQEWKTRILDLAVDNPFEALFLVLTGGALLMYVAEREVNEGINTYDDALYYISTCFSVGYANVFPKTQMGKLIAAIVMAIGPSLSSWVIEGRLVARTAEAAVPAPPPPDLAPVVEKLDAILQELRALRTNGSAG